MSPEGIDFVMKKGSDTCDVLAAGRPISILHLHGRYLPGEQAEQWRGEGYCERISLKEVINHLPEYTKISMVSSKRIEKESPQTSMEEIRSEVSVVCSTTPKFH